MSTIVRPVQLPFGTRLEFEGDAAVAARDRYGTLAWSARGDPDAWTGFTLRPPSGQPFEVTVDGVVDPLLGACDRIDVHGQEVGRFGRIDWAAPDRIPPLARPGELAPGVGSTVLGFLARWATLHRVGQLRYRGPYPTTALFDALSFAFAVQHGPRDRDRFTANVEAIALAGRAVEVPVDFVPTPAEWTWPAPRVCVEHRAGVERVFIDGSAYTRDGPGCRRLRPHGDGQVACIEFGERRWADVLVVDALGHPIAGPHALPPADPQVRGLVLPPATQAALTAILAARAPRLLQRALTDELRCRSLRFGDTGSTSARLDGHDAIEIHAALAEPIASADPQTSLRWLIEALEPVAQTAAQRRLAEVFARRPGG